MAQLIRLCINNFNRYSLGKDKFFHVIGELYKNLSPSGNSPNVKGFMGRMMEKRKGEVAG